MEKDLQLDYIVHVHNVVSAYVCVRALNILK